MTSLDTQAGLLAVLEQERMALQEVLPRFSEQQWSTSSRSDGWTVHDIVGHLATATYGLSRMVTGELEVTTPVDPETGWINPDEINEQLRRKSASLSREKITQRLMNALDSAQQAIVATPDLAAPGPGGSAHTSGAWLERIVVHVQSHRQELQELLELA